MHEEGIILGYWTEIDSYRFGYEVYRYYFVFQNATSALKEEIKDVLINYKNTWVVGQIKGLYDMGAVIWVKSTPEFYKFWDSFNEKYGDYFSEKIFSVYLQCDVYPLSYLLADTCSKSDRDTYLQTVGGESVGITKADYELLHVLVENARMPLVDMAEQLHCTAQSVNHRMKKLLKNGIIQGFHVRIDNFKIGFKDFKVDIWLKEVSKRRKIWNYLKYNPYVTFINTSAGYADLEIEFTIEDSDKIIDIMEDVSSKFPGSIRKYVYWSSKIFKLRSLPEIY